MIVLLTVQLPTLESDRVPFALDVDAFVYAREHKINATLTGALVVFAKNGTESQTIVVIEDVATVAVRVAEAKRLAQQTSADEWLKTIIRALPEIDTVVKTFSPNG